jgi:hypothetical protein
MNVRTDTETDTDTDMERNTDMEIGIELVMFAKGTVWRNNPFSTMWITYRMEYHGQGSTDLHTCSATSR